MRERGQVKPEEIKPEASIDDFEWPRDCFNRRFENSRTPQKRLGVLHCKWECDATATCARQQNFLFFQSAHLPFFRPLSHPSVPLDASVYETRVGRSQPVPTCGARKLDPNHPVLLAATIFGRLERMESDCTERVFGETRGDTSDINSAALKFLDRSDIHGDIMLGHARLVTYDWQRGWIRSRKIVSRKESSEAT